MACFSPLVAFQRHDGDPLYGFRKYSENDAINFDDIKAHAEFYKVKTYLLPCGGCLGCRLDYALNWSTRCMLEAKKYEFNYFLTLTYSDENLVYGVKGNATLVPDHFTKFMKRLRKHYGDGIRFFACGEYGDSTMRPHFHLILFNMPELKDLKFYKFNVQKDIVYTSPALEKLWGYGFVTLGAVTAQSCNYVARYVMKKQKGLTSAFYDELGIHSEFSRMSRRPGIAKEYFEKSMNDVFNNGCIILPDGKSVGIPRYAKKMLKEEDPEYFEHVKLFNETRAELKKEFLKSQTNLNDYELIKLQEKELKNKSKLLKRVDN